MDFGHWLNVTKVIYLGSKTGTCVCGKLTHLQQCKRDRAQVLKGLAFPVRSGRLSLQSSHLLRTDLPMTNRVSYAPQDFEKMCKQAERDHETKKLVFLMERLKRQMAERSNGGT